MCLDEEARTYAFKALTELRAYGYRCEMDMLGRGFKGQFKAADRSHAQFALLLGNNEAQDQNCHNSISLTAFSVGLHPIIRKYET